MSRALSRSLAVVALLAVVSATLVVVTPSLARIVVRGGHPQPAPQPSWLWQSHIYGGSAVPVAKPKPPVKRGHRPYTPPVERSTQP
jgi:hypothetical protein